MHSNITKNSSIFKLKLCEISLLFVLTPSVSFADEYDTLQFNAGVSRTFDNNLFRQNSNPVSDQITVASAGVRFNKSYALQRFIVGVNHVDYSYQNNTYLSYDATNYDASWNWSLTPSLTGVMSTAQTQSLLGFTDYRANQQLILTRKTNQFRAEYSPHQVWALIGGVTNVSTSNSQVFAAQTSSQFDGLDYGARYNYSSGASFTFLGHHRNGSYLNRPLDPSLFIDNGFTEDEYEIDSVFISNQNSHLTGKISYLSRQQNHFSIRNYNYVTGNISYDTLLTGKLSLITSLSRTASQFMTTYSTISLRDGVNASLKYDLSEKISFRLKGGYAHRQFLTPIVTNVVLRNDNEYNYGVSMNWDPTSNVSLSLTTLKSVRNTSQTYNSFSYDDLTTTLNLQVNM